jgi:predicted PurR-regulated permease PerM
MEPADPLERDEHVETRRVEVSVKTLLLVPCIAAGCFVLWKLLPVVLVVIMALLLVGTLNPAVRWLEQRGWKRGVAVMVVFGTVAITLIGLCVLTIAPFVSQVKSLVEHEPELRDKLADTLAKTSFTSGFADKLRHFEWGQLAETSALSVLTASTHVFEAIAYAVSAVFLALYIMLDRDRLLGGLFALTPRAYHLRLGRVLLNLETIVGGYIRGQALTCALVAIFTLIVLTACSVPNPLALAMLAGVVDLLPYIGAALAVGPAALTAATKGIPTMLIVAGLLLAYQEFESRVIVPRVYGRVLRLPSSVVLFALLAGGVLMGILGALLALPAAAALRMLLLSFRSALPGECVDDERWRERDEREEHEYFEASRDAPAEQAAMLALKISFERLRQEGELALEMPMTFGIARAGKHAMARSPH